jgi:phosphotriesterase-related protein
MTPVQTYLGPRAVDDLGLTLMHEHVFVRSPELDADLPDPEWSEAKAIQRAVDGLTTLHTLGVRTLVDLTVPGLGRDVRTIAAVADRSPVNLIASTGYYSSGALPPYFGIRGPGRLIDGPDPLVELFTRDIEVGIAGTGVRAGMLKVMTTGAVIDGDTARVMIAAAVAHQQTGVPITTHSESSLRNGSLQQAFLRQHGVAPERVIIGHAGDTEDIDYLRALMDEGATIGMDRFGMEHVLPDDRRIETVLALLELGYVDRMILSQDAAFYSRVTPPSWRAQAAPNWHVENLSRRILPWLRQRGVADSDLHQMLVANPRRLLEPLATQTH